jgi:HJR/Mrr/RecB family endonuclease
MFRLLSGALGILGLFVAGVVAVGLRWPLWTAAALIVFWLIGRNQRLQAEARQRALVLGAPDPASMSPIEYEQHCAELLRAAGWSVSLTSASGDHGVDVVAELRGVHAAVQAKRYAGRAGNVCVQQVVAGKRLYGCTIAVVAAPNGYTRSAQQAAQANGVLLISHSDLPSLDRLARVP